MRRVATIRMRIISSPKLSLIISLIPRYLKKRGNEKAKSMLKVSLEQGKYQKFLNCWVEIMKISKTHHFTILLYRTCSLWFKVFFNTLSSYLEPTVSKSQNRLPFTVTAEHVLLLLKPRLNII